MHTEIKPDGPMWAVVVQPGGEPAYFATEREAIRFAFAPPAPSRIMALAIPLPPPVPLPPLLTPTVPSGNVAPLQCGPSNEVWRPGEEDEDPPWENVVVGVVEQAV
jgi:hypothetical protein